MSSAFNYRHLYYFWVVATEGGMARAAARLGMAVQTVSAQVRELEQSLGRALLKPAGRGLALTEAGEAALRQADQIFQLGEQLPALVRDAADRPALRLAVGIFDGLPKLAVHHLMAPVLGEPLLRLVCREADVESLLADLALHRLDVVLADRNAPPNPALRVYSHPLGRAPLAWYAPPALAAQARETFPRSLEQLPVLLPTTHVAVRQRLDHWFERQGLRAKVVAEFDDSALMKTFGGGGLGLFPAAAQLEDDLASRFGVQPIGLAEGVEEHYVAIATERKITHPLVQRLLPAGQ
jgi:LysR family transcriptional regulator, transcriptional activator of nhaA